MLSVFLGRSEYFTELSLAIPNATCMRAGGGGGGGGGGGFEKRGKPAAALNLLGNSQCFSSSNTPLKKS